MNRRQLTKREETVVELLREGLSNREIASRLGRSESTMKAYIRTIMLKWNCRNRTQVAVKATERLLRDAPDAATPFIARGDGDGDDRRGEVYHLFSDPGITERAK